MTKPNDGTPPAGREPEDKAGQEISWQSAMDAQPDAPREPAAADTEANTAVPAASSGATEHAHGPNDPGGSGGVDFVLASSPATEAKAEKTGSAFGDKAKEADSLWASLGGTSASGNAEPGVPSEPGVPLDSGAPAAPGAPSGIEGGSPADGAAGYAFGPVAERPSDGAAAAEPDKKDAKAKGKGKKQATPRVPSAGPFNGKTFGPVLPSQPVMLNEEGVLVPTPPTVTSRLFTVLALIPILLPLALFLAQVVFTLDVRALWYSDEVRYAAAYRGMVDSADWFVLHLNGVPYPDKPPLFFWFLYGLDEAAKLVLPLVPFSVTMTDTMLFFTGVAVSGLLCLLAAHALASFVGRVDRRTVLASDLVLISGFFFAGLAHYLRMDLLFTACITFSHVFMFHAYVRDKAPLLMLLGWLLAGAAVLVKGPLGLAFPFLAVLCFLVWQGRLLRFFKLDSLFGLVAGLAVPCVWLALATMNAGPAGEAFLDNILNKQILDRALNAWHHAEPWYHYLWTFPLIWLPWTLVLLFLPWGRFMGKGMRDGLKVSRTRDGAGIAYLWCAFLPGFVLLSLVSIKIPIYCLPLFPPLAVLTARAVLRMRPLASAWLQYSLALVLALLGLVLIVLPALPPAYLPLPYVPRGVMLLGGICLLFAIMLAFLVKPRRTEGAVLLVALFTTAFAFPMWSVTAPSLDGFLSPKAQADIMKDYRAAGYAPATVNVYPGTYTYYAGGTRDFKEWGEALAFADQTPKTVIALRAKDWDGLAGSAEGFVEVDRRTIAERAYVLVARPPLAGSAPRDEVITEQGEMGRDGATPLEGGQQADPDAAARDAEGDAGGASSAPGPQTGSEVPQGGDSGQDASGDAPAGPPADAPETGPDTAPAQEAPADASADPVPAQ